MPGMRLARATVLTAAITGLLAPSASAALRPANRCLALVFAGSQQRVGPFFFKPTAVGRYMLGDGQGKVLAEAAGGSTERAATPGPAAEWGLADSGLHATGTGHFLALKDSALVTATSLAR